MTMKVRSNGWSIWAVVLSSGLVAPALAEETAAAEDVPGSELVTVDTEPADPGISDEDGVVEIDGILYIVDADGNLMPLIEDEAEAVVVTGSRVREVAEKGTVKVEVLSRDEIIEKGGSNLADVLEGEAGLQVTSSLGTGKGIVMDGLDGKYVLVLVDGRPVYGRVDSRLDFSRVNINPENIERIEIVRGPMSALYGSEALGGVINIITRTPKESFEASISLDQMLFPEELASGGSPIQTAGSAHVGGRLGKVAAKLDTYGVWARSYDRNHDTKTDAPGRSQGGFRSEVRGYPGDRTTVLGYAEGSTTTLGAKVTADAPFSEQTRDNSVAIGAGLERTVLEDHTLKLDLRGDFFRHRFFRVTQGTEGVQHENVRSAANQNQMRSEAQYLAPLLRDLPFADRLELVVGGTATTEGVTRTGADGEDTLWGNKTRVTGALYGELLYRPWPFFTLIPGVRFDGVTGAVKAGEETYESGYPKEYGNANMTHLGPKIAARLDGPWGLALRASYGEGFRVPTFLERFLIFDHSELGYIIFGNPYLEPEKSRGVRVGAQANPTPRLGLDVELYLNLLENLVGIASIGEDAAGTEMFIYANYARAYTSGVIVSAHARKFWGVDVTLSYQYLINAVDSSWCPEENPYFCDDVVSLPLRPAHSGRLKISWQAPRLDTRIFWELDATSERPVTDDEVLPGYVLVALGVRQPITEHAEVSVVLDNVTNAYHPIYGPKPGRALMVGMRASY